MAHPIVMSSFGSYAAEGKLIGWLKAAGETVDAGQAIAEIETEKATYEVEAPVSGILHPLAQPGVDLPLESVIGLVLQPGERPPDGSNGTSSVPAAVTTAAVDTDRVHAQISHEIHASPIAKRLAREHGIDLAGIAGSGPGGRIVESDVTIAAARRSANGGAAPGTLRKIRMQLPLTGMRGSIARRMRESLATAASLTIAREVEAEALVATYKRLRLAWGPELTYDALFVKLLADSLQEHPELNAVVQQDAVLVLDEINVGFAVAVPGGLLVPVVHDAASRRLSGIARSTHQMRAQALAGHLRPEQVSGGTATITNLGSQGVDVFTPILNPPESLILGVGRIAERAIVRNHQLAAVPTVVLNLTFDHRVADGVPAAQLLEAVAKRITDPDYFAGLG